MNGELGGVIFLVVAHTDPVMFGRLVNSLQPFRVVVHIDKKSDEEPFRRAAPSNVEFTQRRVRVNWAGFSQIEAIEILLDHVAASAPSTHLILLTGQDFPSQNPAKFVDALRHSPGIQFVNHFLLDGSSRKYSWQVDRRHYQDLAPRLPRIARRAAIRILRVLTSWRRVQPPAGTAVSHGHANWVITREFASTVTRALADPRLRRYLRRVFASDEKFVPTILRSTSEATYDSRKCSGRYQGDGNWRYTNFHYIDPSLRILGMQDVDSIRRSGAYFVRKVTSSESLDLVDALEKSWGESSEA